MKPKTREFIKSEQLHLQALIDSGATVYLGPENFEKTLRKILEMEDDTSV